jgi:UDP-N-acetyl-D-glucosamine dehydrogenase
MSMREEILKKVEDRTAIVGVIGLGYVGLPLTVDFAEEGYRVIGVDVNAAKVNMVNQGNSYIPDTPSEVLKGYVEKGLIRASADYSVLSEADFVFIAVPTPLSKTRDPDMGFVMSAVRSFAPHLRRGHVVSLESTVYPGTTDEVIKPELEKTGLVAGKDFFLTFSPERINPGDPIHRPKNTPKVVGGVDPVSTELVCAIYNKVVKKAVPMSSAKTAEMVKLLENTFRAVNIALVNELAIMCELLGIDVWEVIDGAETKGFGFMKFLPGPGIGGHCIPIDPLYLSWKMKTLNYNARMIEVASEINTSMPRHVVELVANALNDEKKPLNGSRILVIGVAYKPDIGDTRESPALDVIKLLREKGALVSYHDPYVPDLHEEGMDMVSVKLTDEVLSSSDVVVITTDHACIDWQMILDKAGLVIDTRNATRGKGGKARVVKI